MSDRKVLFARCGGFFMCLLLLAGCLSVPLGDPEKSTVDARLIGWWQSADQTQGDRQLISVQAYDQRTYLLLYYGYAKDGASITPKGSLIYKAWLTPIGDARFLTAAMMNPQPPTAKDTEKDRYFVSRVEPVDGGWSSRDVSDDFLKDCTTPDALQKKITENVNNDALYAQKPVMFQKANDDLVAAVLKAFNQNP